MATSRARPALGVVRRNHLRGDDVHRWFAAQGWTSTASDRSFANAFIDELDLPTVRVRRIWHTPLSLRRRPRDGSPPQNEHEMLVVMQVDGSCRLESDAARRTVLEPHATLFATPSSIAWLDSDEPTARIEIDCPWVDLDRIADWTALSPAEGEAATTWPVMTATINALLNSTQPISPASRPLIGSSLESFVRALAYELLTVAPVSEESADRRRSYGSLYEEASEVIFASATRVDFTVADLAERLGVTTRSLARAFASHGTSPAQQIRTRRIERARAVLARQSKAAWEDIARESGFPSARSVREALQEAS